MDGVRTGHGGSGLDGAAAQVKVLPPSPSADLKEAEGYQVCEATRALAGKIKRSKGGIDLLGGAAAAMQDITTRVQLGSGPAQGAASSEVE